MKNRGGIIVVAVILVALVAIGAYLAWSDQVPDPPEVPVAADMAEYADGIYDGHLEGDTVVLEPTTMDACGSDGLVLMGAGWVESRNPVEVGQMVLSLLESGVTVASTDPSVFESLRAIHPFAVEDGSSLSAVCLQEDGPVLCYSGSAPTAEGVLSGLAEWMDDHMGDARWYFAVGSYWSVEVMSVADHDYGDWGRTVLASVYAFNTSSSQAQMGEAHTLMYYKDGSLLPQTIRVSGTADSGGRLYEYAPRGSSENFGNDSYYTVGIGLRLDGKIYWPYTEIPLIDRSNTYEGVYDMEYDVSWMRSTYQIDMTFGSSWFAEREPEDYRGSVTVSLTVDGHGATETLEQTYSGYMPYPMDA